MKAIEFQVVVDAEQVIRPPEGVILPQGKVDVLVRAAADDDMERAAGLADTRQWLLEMAAEAERSAPPLPPDVAEHHDYYAHGTPLS